MERFYKFPIIPRIAAGGRELDGEAIKGFCLVYCHEREHMLSSGRKTSEIMVLTHLEALHNKT